MKLSKYVGLVKRSGYCVVNHVENSGVWLGTKAAIYRDRAAGYVRRGTGRGGTGH